MDPHEALLRALRIPPSDLEANRLGRLGPSQRRRTLRNTALGVAFGLGFSAWVLVATVNQARMPGVEVQNWRIPGVVGLAVAVLTVIVALTTMRGMQRRVECLTGILSLRLVRVGRGGIAAKLQVRRPVVRLLDAQQHHGDADARPGRPPQARLRDARPRHRGDHPRHLLARHRCHAPCDAASTLDALLRKAPG